ncbi:hypothetical protein LMG18101_05009 [Ralstonia flaminis]|jgi:hypothetical protein|uniref:Uncharacterized protein n=1 Tax=Ralstonia flaminis TaxID=3058597 RepID=A0ABM9KDT9_9RALS|nr:hypothetical protein LMG18101_05009 [Ralstonia sp. LMG 18101]
MWEDATVNEGELASPQPVIRFNPASAAIPTL